MTITIGEALSREVYLKDRATVDWAEIVYQIIMNRQFFTIKEIQEFFVNNKVQDQRVKLVMDSAHEKGILDRRLHENMFIYGVSEKWEQWI